MCDHCGCREFAPIAELTAEHVEILEMAWAMVEATRAHRVITQSEIDALLKILDCHVVKEESGLYPKLMSVDGLSDAENAALEKEHVEIREAIVAGGFDHHDYYALAAHIEVEELELFSGAMWRFDDGEWDEMGQAHEIANAAISS